MRVAARLVLRSSKFDPISADICDRLHWLHWLPIRSRIDFKLGLLVYKCLYGNAPPYLVEMLQLKSEVPALRRLRSTAWGDLVVPRILIMTFGPRSFFCFRRCILELVTRSPQSPLIVNPYFLKETQIVCIPSTRII